MRVHQEVNERVQYVERFEILVSGRATSIRSAEYPFSRAANRQMPISKWLETRFKSAYPDLRASVIYPDGSKVQPDIPVGIVRDAYQKCNIAYGQSLHFKFSSEDVSSILELRRILQSAGIEAKFAQPSLLWIWKWFTAEGEILHIHLPLCYHLELPNILKSLTSSSTVDFSSYFDSDSSHLFEADSSYSFFGIEQFQILKSVAEKF